MARRTNMKINNKKKNDALSTLLETRQVIIHPDRFPFPNHFRSSWRYYQQIDFSAVTTPQVYVFRGNSPYDPDQTGTGVQPQGWDDMLTWYESSYCIGSQLRVRVFNRNTQQLQFSMVATPQSSTITTWLGIATYPNFRELICDGSTYGGKSFGSLTRVQSTLGFYGGDFDRDYIATGNAVSGKQWYWTMVLNSPDGATALTCSIQIEVYYDIVWFDRKNKALS